MCTKPQPQQHFSSPCPRNHNRSSISRVGRALALLMSRRHHDLLRLSYVSLSSFASRRLPPVWPRRVSRSVNNSMLLTHVRLTRRLCLKLLLRYLCQYLILCMHRAWLHQRLHLLTICHLRQLLRLRLTLCLQQSLEPETTCRTEQRDIGKSPLCGWRGQSASNSDNALHFGSNGGIGLHRCHDR